MIREIIYEAEGKQKLAQGIRKLCEALRLEGKILVQGSFTYSAGIVAKELEGNDLWENQGIRLAADAITELNTTTGCGTAGAAELILSMLKECERLTAGGTNPIGLANELKRASTELAEQFLRMAGQEKRSMLELIQEVVKEEKKAQLVATAMETGEVIVKETMGMDTCLEITRGMSIDGALLCGKKMTLQEVYVMVSDCEIESFQTLLPILEKLEGAPLFLIAEDIKGEALTLLSTNVSKGILKVWAMKAPGIGKRKSDLLGDLAVLTQTTVINELEIEQEGISLEQLGKAAKIEMTTRGCLVSGSCEKEAISDRIAQIQQKINMPDTNYYDQQLLRERIAVLSGIVPVLYAGGATSAEAKEEKRRLEYAVAFGQTTKEHGVFSMEQLEAVKVETTGMKVIVTAIRKAFPKGDVSAWLLHLSVKKVAGMMRMWLTTGAVMVSTRFDREDIELMKNGVDVNRLRGS